MKVFEGDMLNDLLTDIRRSFGSVRLHGPKASRSSSSEIYIVAKGYKEGGSSQAGAPGPLD
jgi:23S rRNA (uridine2552-2'-O)-methyltransferase